MTSILYKLEPLYKKFPEIKGPGRHVPFKEKLMWTGIILILFFAMGQIVPLGATTETARDLGAIQIILASQLGTLMSIGIGPIVTASIILQLLIGAKIIGLDLHKTEDRAVFQGTQKLLVVLVSFFEAFALTRFGTIPVTDPTSFPLILFVTAQVAFASIILMFFDEIVSKWGIGSGIGLFIAAGVSQHMITRAFSFIPTGEGQFAGIIPSFLALLASGQLNLIVLFPLLATVLVFLIVVYSESLKIEIPLSYGRFGIGARYPLRFFYTSNIPVILASALLANVNLFAVVFAGTGVPILGHVDNSNRIIANLEEGGLGFLITEGNLYGILNPSRIYELSNPDTIIHLIVYAIFFMMLCVLFGVFWVMMTNMDAKSVADQMQQSGLQIPGFRADSRVIERVLDRYIPQLTVVSAVAVGLLAVVADLTGALGTGTGILLTVGILYRMYEEIKKEQMGEMSPAIRRFLGKEKI